MLFLPEKQEQALFVAALLAAALIHVSIAASQTMLALGLLLMLVFWKRLPFPRIWLPLAAFFGWTVLSLFASVDPWGGRAQIRKFFVFLLIPLIYGVFSRYFERSYYLFAGWAITAGASGIWGLIQFFLKYQHAQVTGEDFYSAYTGARITGFESHWMTFGALQLGVLLLLLSQLFFARKLLPKWSYAIVAVLALTIVLGWTRSIWVAALPSALYLFWFWRPKLIWIVPVLIALIFAFAPSETTERLNSLINPHGDIDSNQHRMVTFQTGLQMIKAHPLLGLGPEQVGKQFQSYVPATIPRPLPTGYYGHLHNIYLQYAAERGVPAMLLMMWFIGLTLWDCVQALRAIPTGRSQERCILQGAIAFILAILVEGFAEFNLGDSEVLMMFVTVVALAYAAIDRTRNRHPTMQPSL